MYPFISLYLAYLYLSFAVVALYPANYCPAVAIVQIPPLWEYKDIMLSDIILFNVLKQSPPQCVTFLHLY